MKESIIRLIYKKDERKNFKNQRLILFFNVDYKICLKVFFLRLFKVLSIIVDSD